MNRLESISEILVNVDRASFPIDASAAFLYCLSSSGRILVARALFEGSRMAAVNDIEKIAAKIRALLAKTIENGCTEQEALAAAAKAAQILSEHDLTLDEIEERKEEFVERERPAADIVGQHLWKVAHAVADLCQVRTWCDHIGRAQTTLTFFGLESDVEIAGYILSIAERAMRDAADKLERENILLRPSVRRRRSITFIDGMADRLEEKISEIAWTRSKQMGKGIVVAKAGLIREELAKRGISTKSKEDRYSQVGFSGYDAGRRAAEGIAFDAAVTASEMSIRLLGTDEP